MKKFKYIFLLILMFVPVKIWAVNIKDTVIKGADEVYTSKNYSYELEISFSDLDKNNEKSLGLYAVVYELIFNDQVMSVSNISSKGRWDSSLYTENGKYYVLSEIGAYSDEVNKCMDGILYCDNYFATISFNIKKTDTIKTADIEVGEITAGLLPTVKSVDDVKEENVVMIYGKGDVKKTLKIKKSDAVLDEGVEIMTVNEKKPVISKEKIVQGVKEATPVSNKSKNNYLESLEVEGYEIDFKKYYNEYRLTIPQEVNELKIKYVTVDKNAKVEIIGNNDLSANDNEIQIEVTSENGEKNIYRIKVKKEPEEVITEKKDGLFNIDIQIDEKYLKIGGIILGGLLFIILFIRLILKIKDHKMEKQLDKL